MSLSRLGFRVLVLVSAVLGGLLLTASPARAGTIVVNSTSDGASICPASCTLREAISLAAPIDTITFSVTGTILLNSPLTITSNVTITGPGASTLTVDGQTTVRVFQIDPGIQAQISGLTIQHGLANDGSGGGGIRSAGTLMLADMILRDNVAIASGGGAIHNAFGASLTVTRSLLTGNTAGGGGGIDSGGTLSVTSSTFTDNVAEAGGAIALSVSSGTVTNSTFTNNVADSDGAELWTGSGAVLTVTNSTIIAGPDTFAGVPMLFALNSAIMNLRNSIIVGDSRSVACLGASAGSIVSQGNNLGTTTECFTGTSQGDIVTATPLLGPLALNAPGTTPSFALLPGSPALDGATFTPTDCGGAVPGAVTTDQRGVARPQAGGEGRCDIGAYEARTPGISAISGPTIQEDTTTAALPFVLSNALGPVSSLALTVQSSDQTLLPDSGIELNGTDAARALRLTPVTNRSGTAQVTLAATNAEGRVERQFTLTVVPVNDPPVALNDAYPGAATQTLTVAAAAGVLKNDTDVETASNQLTAVIAQPPAHGALSLQPDGSFTYTPAARFSGTDSFTYRASDGGAQSSPATVTLTVEPSRCAPRASVKVTSAVVSGRLQATVETLPLDGQTNNRLQEIRFGAFQNGKVTLNGQSIASGAVYTPPITTTQVTFTVERVTPGQATTIPLTVVDACGSWPSFVGGGPGAGF